MVVVVSIDKMSEVAVAVSAVSVSLVCDTEAKVSVVEAIPSLVVESLTSPGPRDSVTGDEEADSCSVLEVAASVPLDVSVEDASIAAESDVLEDTGLHGPA